MQAGRGPPAVGDHLGPLAAELAGDGRPDAAGRTGDQGVQSRKPTRRDGWACGRGAHVVARHSGEQFPHRPPARRVNRVRGDLGQRHQHERPLVHPRVRDGHLEVGSQLRQRLQDEAPFVEPRMWDLEQRLVDGRVPVEEQVEVERPRRVGLGPGAAELPLDVEEQFQQLFGGTVRLDGDGGVEVVAGARRAVHGRGLVQPGDGDHPQAGLGPQPSDRRGQVRPPVAEVAAEAEVRGAHGEGKRKK